MTKAVRRELDSISKYTAPSINRVISVKGGPPGDLVSRILTKKERLQERLCIILELCFYFEEAAQAEIETVDNLEFKALVIDRYTYYIIGDRGTRSFAALHELYAGVGQVAFFAKECVDGKLILPEAVQVLKMKA